MHNYFDIFVGDALTFILQNICDEMHSRPPQEVVCMTVTHLGGCLHFIVVHVSSDRPRFVLKPCVSRALLSPLVIPEHQIHIKDIFYCG